MKNKKMFLVVIAIICCFSCSNKPQELSEAKDNLLLGNWIDKDTGNTLRFIELDGFPDMYLVDNIEKNDPSAYSWELRYARFDDFFFLFLEQADATVETYWVEKIGKRKMILQPDRDEPDGFIVLTRYSKLKRFIDQHLLYRN